MRPLKGNWIFITGLKGRKMKSHIHTLHAGMITLMLLFPLQNGMAASSQTDSSSATSETGKAPAGKSDERREKAAIRHVDDAVAVVQRMEQEPRMKELLAKAKGVFIVPTYGRAALGVGASGGSGVLLVKEGAQKWSEPAFYNIGGINVGLQAGGEGGAIAMVLNNDKAVQKFMQKNNFSLSADAGLTVVNWTKVAQGTAGEGDVVVWSGTKGLFGDAVAIGVNDIRFNQNLTTAYYHQNVSPKDVVAGKAKSQHTEKLKQALSGMHSGTSSTGASGGSEASGTSKSK
jgi:SH3 domain-containing YSC84-like protein 1